MPLCFSVIVPDFLFRFGTHLSLFISAVLHVLQLCPLPFIILCVWGYLLTLLGLLALLAYLVCFQPVSTNSVHLIYFPSDGFCVLYQLELNVC